MSSAVPPPSQPAQPPAQPPAARRRAMSPALIVVLVLLGLGAILAASTLAVMALSGDAADEPAGRASRPAADASRSGTTVRLRGRVVSFTGVTLVVRAQGTDTSVTVRSDTPIGNKANPATRDDIKPGAVVVVVGPAEDPQRILVPEPGAGGRTRSGSVSPSPTG